MSCGRKIGPYECYSVVCGDCLELMRELPDGCEDYCRIARERIAAVEAQPSLFAPKAEQLSLNGGAE